MSRGSSKLLSIDIYYPHMRARPQQQTRRPPMLLWIDGSDRRMDTRPFYDAHRKTWTGLCVEESVGMTEDRDKWRKYVHGVDNPRIEDG